MERKNIKPVYVFWQDGVTAQQLAGAIRGIAKTLAAAQVRRYVRIVKDPRITRRPIEVNGVCYESHIAWLLAEGRKKSARTGSLDADVILTHIATNPLQRAEPHYAAVIVKDRLCTVKKINQVARIIPHSGYGQSGNGFIMSVYRDDEMDNVSDGDYCMLLAGHEMGHVCGDPDHCANPCMMIQDWESTWHLVEKIKQRPFCDDCRSVLRQYFLDTDEETP